MDDASVARAVPRRDTFREPASGELSAFVLISVLLRRWRLVVGTMLLFGIAGTTIALIRPPRFVASASFMPQGADNAKNGLAGLVGQLGVSMPMQSQGAFYVELLNSRELLAPIVREPLLLPPPDGRRATLIDLLKVEGRSPEESEMLAVRQLKRLIDASDSKTGVVQLAVTTPWPTVSQHVAAEMLQRLNEFNLKTRQSQAGEERRFVGERLSMARDSLRESEDRLKRFLQTNRQFMGSPELTFEHDRLLRATSLNLSLVSTLATSYEDARSREVRDTPVFTVIEPPRVPPTKEPTFWWLFLFLGMLIGALLSAFAALASYAVRRRRAAGDPDAEELLALLGRLSPRGRPSAYRPTP